MELVRRVLIGLLALALLLIFPGDAWTATNLPVANPGFENYVGGNLWDVESWVAVGTGSAKGDPGDPHGEDYALMAYPDAVYCQVMSLPTDGSVSRITVTGWGRAQGGPGYLGASVSDSACAIGSSPDVVSAPIGQATWGQVTATFDLPQSGGDYLNIYVDASGLDSGELVWFDDIEVSGDSPTAVGIGGLSATSWWGLLPAIVLLPLVVLFGRSRRRR